MRKIILAALAIASAGVLAGCTSQADTVSDNLSKEAEKFQVVRRIVGINGITDKVEFEAVGRCSVEGNGLGNLRALIVICKDPDGYRKHFIGQSDNMTFIVTQIPAVNVSEYRTTFNIKPESIVPNFDLVTSG